MDVWIRADSEGRLVELSLSPIEGASEQPEVRTQLQQYFAGTRKSFELDLAPAGTPFQQRVWTALQTIPHGQTRSYAWLAAQVGSVARAVGSANGANPIAIVIPCHRVIGADGSLTGYAGGLEAKRWLLDHEAAQTRLF
jgi:methylated-DNA-[protein]-cysteine S-methyltransferase